MVVERGVYRIHSDAQWYNNHTSLVLQPLPHDLATVQLSDHHPKKPIVYNRYCNDCYCHSQELLVCYHYI